MTKPCLLKKGVVVRRDKDCNYLATINKSLEDAWGGCQAQRWKHVADGLLVFIWHKVDGIIKEQDYLKILHQKSTTTRLKPGQFLLQEDGPDKNKN